MPGGYVNGTYVWVDEGPLPTEAPPPVFGTVSGTSTIPGNPDFNPRTQRTNPTVPDFTQDNPFAGMSSDAIARSKASFVPSADNPLPPWVGEKADPEKNVYYDENGKKVTFKTKKEADKFEAKLNELSKTISEKELAKNYIKTPNGWIKKTVYDALQKLEPYKTGGETLGKQVNPVTGKTRSGQAGEKTQEGYDIHTFILNSKSPGEAFKTLQDAGFSWEDIQQATKYNSQMANDAHKQVLSQYSASGVAKYGGDIAADMIVPGYYTSRHWDELGAGERATSIVIDVISILPIIGAAGAGARTVATAGRMARLGGAAKGVGRELIAQVRAPVDMIAHPVATVKGTVGTVRDLGETLLHPKKIPEAVLTTSKGTVRLRVSEATTPEEAMKIRDTLTDLAAKGEKPLVEINGIKYELSQSPFMKEAGGGMVHATPDIEVLEGATVKTKAGMPSKEQGWFLASEPATGFTESSAFGKGNIPVPAGASGKVVDIGKYRPNELVNLDKRAIRPLNFNDAKNIPTDISQDIFAYVKKNDAVLYGSMNEWVKVKNAAKPNDLDLVFKNADKAINDIKEIAQKAGYKAREVPHGVEIFKDGEWIKLGDIVSESQHQKMLPLPMVTRRINGVRVETLGKQYIGQSYGAVDKSAKASTRAKKLETAANDVKNIIKESGITQKKPGMYVINSESAKKTISSGKIFDAKGTGPVVEMEKVLPVGEKIPGVNQKLYTRIGPQKQRVEIYLEKPLSKTQILKLKSLGLIEDFKAPFKPAIAVSSDMAGLDSKGVKALVNALDESDNRAVGRVLSRSEDDILRAGERSGQMAGRTTRAATRQGEVNRTVPDRIRPASRTTNVDRATARREVDRPANSRVDTSRVDTGRVEATRIDPTRINPERIEPGRVDPPRIDPPRIDPPRIDPPRIDPPKVDPPRGDLVSDAKSDKSYEPTAEEIKNSTAIKMGIGWWLRFPNGKLKFYKELPPGVENVKAGKGSAYASVQTVAGKPIEAEFKIGAMNVILKKPTHTAGSRAVEFKPDGRMGTPRMIKGVGMTRRVRTGRIQRRK